MVGEVGVGVTDGLAVATSVESETIVPSCVQILRTAFGGLHVSAGRVGKVAAKLLGDVCTIRLRRIGNEVDGPGDRSKFGGIRLRVGMVDRL